MRPQSHPLTVRRFSFLRFIASAAALVLGFAALCAALGFLFPPASPPPLTVSTVSPNSDAVRRLDAAMHAEWESRGVTPTPDADFHTLARRLSLSLTGAVPSLAEIRRLEATPADHRVEAWIDHLLEDGRTHAYLAERLARIYVGVEPGPFLVYRRRRLVNWLRDQLEMNRPYDELVRELVASTGIWTTSPAANFITVSVAEGREGGPDEVKLATRTSRAFLGVSLDCVQCHDDKFGDRWKQEDFHQLAAFFSQTEVALSGVWDNPEREYQTRLKGRREEEILPRAVPFAEELFPESGGPRERLAEWITHPENRSFSRAVANRAWALLFGRPLVTPIDDIPVDGPVPPVLDLLADEFVAADHDFRELIRLIARGTAFRRASTTGDPDRPVTLDEEEAWAAFPLTPLRTEQVAGSVIQAATIQGLDSSAHILRRIQRFGDTNDFVRRFGDHGENEFTEASGTIPQRLLLMNGELVHDRTQPNPLMNASSRIAFLAREPETAVANAFLAVLVRPPTPEEMAHFSPRIGRRPGPHRQRAMQDLFWTLINSTEFSWNR